jgi:hypothetical protein
MFQMEFLNAVPRICGDRDENEQEFMYSESIVF